MIIQPLALIVRELIEQVEHPDKTLFGRRKQI
jgi:hypothetical protein